MRAHVTAETEVLNRLPIWWNLVQFERVDTCVEISVFKKMSLCALQYATMLTTPRYLFFLKYYQFLTLWLMIFHQLIYDCYHLSAGELVQPKLKLFGTHTRPQHHPPHSLLIAVSKICWLTIDVQLLIRHGVQTNSRWRLIGVLNVPWSRTCSEWTLGKKFSHPWMIFLELLA